MLVRGGFDGSRPPLHRLSVLQRTELLAGHLHARARGGPQGLLPGLQLLDQAQQVRVDGLAVVEGGRRAAQVLAALPGVADGVVGFQQVQGPRAVQQEHGDPGALVGEARLEDCLVLLLGRLARGRRDLGQQRGVADEGQGQGQPARVAVAQDLELIRQRRQLVVAHHDEVHSGDSARDDVPHVEPRVVFGRVHAGQDLERFHVHGHAPARDAAYPAQDAHQAHQRHLEAGLRGDILAQFRRRRTGEYAGRGGAQRRGADFVEVEQRLGWLFPRQPAEQVGQDRVDRGHDLEGGLHFFGKGTHGIVEAQRLAQVLRVAHRVVSQDHLHKFAAHQRWEKLSEEPFNIDTGIWHAQVVVLNQFLLQQPDIRLLQDGEA